MKVLTLCFLFCLTSCISAQNNKPPILESQQNKAQAKEVEIADVSLCELLESPEKFDQKLIRVKAIYRYGFEWSEFYSLKCSTKKRVWVEGAETKCKNAGKVDEMDYAGMGGRTVGVVVVGKFTGEKGGYGHMNSFDYLFRIECFEKAKILDRESYVPEALTPEQRHKVEEFEKSN